MPETITKAFIVRFFADSGWRVEGPFPPAQVQRLADRGECQIWLRDWALFAIWGDTPSIATDIATLAMLSTEMNTVARRREHMRHQELRANHYRAQARRHHLDG